MTVPRLPGRLTLNLVLVAVVLALVGWLVLAPGGTPRAAAGSSAVPQDAAMEKATGIRFTRVAVVGDGGLITLFYVVLDSERATVFQSDRDHPPKLISQARHGSTQRASIMRAGHDMRPGQTYYLVYQNTGGAIRPGEQVSISYGGRTLQGVPVL